MLLKPQENMQWLAETNCSRVAISTAIKFCYTKTKESINYAVVSLMKKGGILVNTARKEVINEAELLKLMCEREDLKYLTDIKPDADADFAKFEGRYFSTPKKMGAQTAEANNNAGLAAARQINAFFKDGDTKFQVNK
jgi:D-3-phosphoglycerate dehydrogenase